MSHESTVLVRDATLDDLDTIVRFNQALAHETEHLELPPARLREGVRQALETPERLRYWVACIDGRVVAQTAITPEWSDWRNGWIWWLQSVYVDRDFRSRGLFRSLFHHIEATALATHRVIGLRLYVENENHLAKQTYENLGMRPGGYQVYERFWT